LPTLWPGVIGGGHRAAASSGVGTPRDQAAGSRIPAAPTALPVLRRDDVRHTAAGCGHGTVGATASGLRRAANGLLPPEQATHAPVSGTALEPALLPRPPPQDAGAGNGGAAARLRGACQYLAVATASGDR